MRLGGHKVPAYPTRFGHTHFGPDNPAIRGSRSLQYEPLREIYQQAIRSSEPRFSARMGLRLSTSR